ncbi:MAG: hypothetical protein MRZ73_12335 [Pseudoflavonifractor capillosus]|uniref:ADP-ribosyltransferase-containing protein n=1 Tax=Pseudoflavonifractor capillosus TaxID=106588 RepID=UPI0023F68F46|nr:hypothetical protein [Pseudoflavonifractor capillosus]MCI5929298.1 hypothetical protein [Pseudoflavonifractor capillosus]MDY4661281.1 hypothetical protein [Pseudoflavonifractor capillosus]
MSKLRDAIQASRRGETVGSAGDRSGGGTSVLRQAIQASRRGETVEPTSGAPKLPQSLQSLMETQRSGTGLTSGTSAYRDNAGQRQENAVEQQTGISWPSVENAQENLQSWSGRLDSLHTRLETARTDAQAKAQELENIYTKLQAYQADSQFGSSTLIRSAYDSLAEQYNQLLPSYLKAASEHDSLAEEYNALLEKYQSGYTAYTDMLSGQGARADELLQEAEQAEREANEARTALSGINRYGTKEQRAEWTAKLEEAESRAAQLREQAEQARAYYYASIPLMEDYNQYAKAGTAKGESDDLNLWKFWQERGDNLYDFINDLKQNPEDELSYRQTVELLSTMGGQNGKYGAYTPYSYMTEDEIGIYNYLYATAGREAAEDFLDELMNSLNYRQGEENYENLSGVGKALYWLPAGADSFASGVAQLFSEKALPTSPVQYTSAMVRQEAEETSPVLGTAYDLGTTVSNMAPSILLGTLSAGLLGGAGVAAGTAGAIGSGVTAGTMGLSSAGNAYNRKVSEGYAPEQARSYAALVGMAEGALQYLLGGIAGAGGVTSEQLLSRLAPKIAAIDNALLRTVVDGGVRLTVRGVSEGIEEGMQAFLEPAFATLILDEEYDWGENFENAAYSFLMGFLAADLFEGISMAAGGRHSGGGFDPDMDSYMGQDGTDYFAGCSTEEEVEARYRELARENHPDLGGDTDVMADINRQHDMRKAWFMGRRQAEQAGKKENTRPHAEEETFLSGTAQAFAAAGDTVTEAMDKAAVMDRVLSGDTTLTDNEIAQIGLRSSSTREAFRALTGREITGNTVQERIASVREVMEARKRGSEAARDGAEESPTAVPRERQEPPAAEIPGANYARELQQAGADADTARAVGYLLSRAEQGMTLTEDQRSYIATVPGGAALMDRVQPAAQQPREAGREAGVSLPVEAVPAGDTVREAGAAAPETEMTIGGWNDGRQEQLGEQQPGAAPGDGVPDGGQGRIPGPGAGEQAGGLGTGAARAVPPAEQGRTAIGRQNRGKHLRSERVSSIDLGLSNGTENPSVYVVQETDWDEGLRATAERVRRETGLGVTYVLGSIPVKDARGVVRNVRGVYGTDRIILQADNLRVTTDQIADHEIYHDKAFQTPGLNREVELRIVERYGREEFEAVVAVYAEKLRGVVELSADAAPEEIDAAMQVVKEEIFADAYAGINAFAAHAERFQEGVDEVLEERGLGRSRETAAATDRTTGPPTRYSSQEEGLSLPVSEGLDSTKDTGYDDARSEPVRGGKERGQDAAVRGVHGEDVRGEIEEVHPGGAGEEYAGAAGSGSPDEGGRRAAHASWARGHLIEQPSAESGQAAEHARRYGADAFVVEDAAIKARNPNAWALTSGGKVYISDSIPAELADVVGFHEAIHAAKQRGDSRYRSFLEKTGELLDFGRDRTEFVFRVISESRFEGRNPADLTQRELETAYDELNALVWGYYKADPENARAQFGEMFLDYDGYLAELDAVMEAEPEGLSLPTPDEDTGMVRYSMDEDDGGEQKLTQADIQAVQSIGRKSVNDFTAEDIRAAEPFARRYWAEMGEKSPFFRAWFGDWRANDPTPVEQATEPGDARGQVRNEDTGWNINVSGKVFNETRVHNDSYNKAARPYLPYINDIIKKAVLLDSYTMAVGKTKSANSLLMHSLYAVADIGSGPEIIKLYVEEMNDPNSAGTAKRAYQLQNVEKYRPATKSSQKTASSISAGADTKSVADGLDAVKGGDAAKRAYQLQNIIEISSPTGGKPTISSGKALASLQTADIKSVADLFEAVKRADSNFHPKEPSAVTDEEGRPMAVYHGTDRSFWRFDPELGAYWFSQAEDYAQAMAEERGGDRVLSAYLDMKNPMRVSLPAGTFTDPAAEGPYIRRAKAEGYDGVIFRADTDNPLEADTFYAVFRPEQIKSATDNIGTFDRENRDIRYSMDEEQNTEQTEQQEQPKQKKRATRRQRTTRPVAESLPIIAKRDLKQNLLNLFSIPEGMRAELGTVIDQYADRMLKNGTLTQADRDAFFDRMYAEGVMTVPAEEYYAMGRNAVKGGRVYVPVRDQHEFGDGWNEFRKRAFANGIYLTNNPQDQGIDQWNAELAEMMPGLFDAGELDSRTILERIVQVAEEGRDQKMSLSEYAAELAGREYVSEDEVLDNMERQMDWALRTFAEKARLEITLRDRTGVKIAQEREKFSEAAGRQREREMARRAEERDRRKAQLRRQRENKELRELQQKTLKQLQWLSKNRYRAPEELKEAWDEVLGDIDIYAVGAANEMNWSNKYQATWRDLAQLYKTARDADPNFLPSKELERIVDRLDGDKIADLDVDALADLYKAAVGLRTEFYNRNNVINDELNRLFAEVYTDSKREIETAPGGYKGSGFDRFMNLDQLTPMNVLERMGGWNPDGAFYSMARQLEKGEQDIRAYTVQANRRLEEFLTEHEDWVKRADGQGKDGIWYEIEVPELLELGMGDKPVFGDTVKVYMTPSQKVHMYLESKNTDNLRHMTGGRTFVDRELYSQGKRQEAFAQGRTIRMAPETVKGLVSNLTEEEAELARILEDYYNNFAKGEINRVSNILYGYDKAQSKNYAPIYTNRNYVKSEIGIYDTTAEGVGSLKSRQYAKNPSYNISAFDAFERHVEQTARFVGMAIPARNWTTLLNWREKNDSMGDVITHKWGEESKKYIEDILNRLQGGAAVERDTVGDFADKVLSNYISAIFGANPSIVLKQLGSIPLASVYLGGATFPSLTQITRIDRELIAKYTGDLAWRTMGYSTPETKHLKENPNWTQTNKVTRFAFGGGAITAMDGWAASVLWPWAENKVRRDFPDLEVGTQEQIDAGQSPFYKKVAEAFNEAVSRSQSVSDEIHQGRLRKSRNPITRAFTMFKSDSAQGYNALRQKIGEAKYYERAGDAENTRKARKAVGAAFLSLIGGYLWASAVSFLIAMWKNKGKYYRDDEDELTFGSVAREMTMDLAGSLVGVVAGGEELMDIIGNVLTGDTWYGIDTPGLEQLTDIIELLQKETTNGMDTLKGAADVAGSGGDLVEYMKRHGNDMLGGIKELAEAAATYIPGIPVSNLEAYLLGTVKWISPELGTAYDDLMATAEKSGLSGLEGAALERRVDSILSVRLHDIPEGAAAELAGLYEAGYTQAVPGDTPAKVTVNGEEQALGAYQQQIYDTVWRESVEAPLAQLLEQEWYTSLDDEARAKVLAKLYDYGAQSAKAALFDDFKTDSFVEEISAYQAAGLDTADWLEAWRRFSEIEDGGANASARATEFAYWADSQGYTPEQAKVVKDSFTVFSHIPVEPQRYGDLQEAGLSDSEALELTDALAALEPLEGASAVSDIQRLRAIADAGLDRETTVAAMGTILGTEMTTESGGKSQYALLQEALDAGYTVDEWLELKEAGYMTESTFDKVRISGQYDISPSQYIRYREMLVEEDATNEDPEKRNNSIDQDETAAAINGMLGLSNEQKAVLWQLQNKSWKPNKNPFDKQVGKVVYDYLHGEKEDETPAITDGESLPALSLPGLFG